MTLRTEEIENRPVEAGIAIWFLGGPSLAIRSRDSLMYLDLFTGPAPVAEITRAIPAAIDPAEIRRSDLALSTHHDEDHCDRDALSWIHKNTRSLFLGPVSCNRLYREWGFDLARTRILASGEEFTKGDIRLHATPSNDVFDPDAISFVIRMGGVTLFDGGDTLYFPQMADIGRQWSLDLAFLSYAKSPPGKSCYLDEETVLQAGRDLRAKITILKHYDLWKEFAVDPSPVVDRMTAAGCETRTFGLGQRFSYVHEQ